MSACVYVCDREGGRNLGRGARLAVGVEALVLAHSHQIDRRQMIDAGSLW